MTPPLTDAQVAALASGTWYGDAGFEYDPFDGHPAAWEVAEALALEVQQSRQRRCGNCLRWTRTENGGRQYGDCSVFRFVPDEGTSYAIETEESWSCADFTPKAPTTEEPAS